MAGQVNRFYTGGEFPTKTPKPLPSSNINDDWTKASGYVASADLIAAVNVAITLGRPLLVTGEPGTGKSELAKSVAYDLGLGSPLEYVIKSDTESRDLFYGFDSIGRFNAPKNNGKDSGAAAFITYKALGEAILRANDPAQVKAYYRGGNAPHAAAQRSVVLIDEMDKAPRDVPNDILSEIDRLEFEIPELSLETGSLVKVKADPKHRPIVIITSNLEKSLPDAFLRRCVYFHLEFPKPDQLQEILRKRLGDLYKSHSPFLASALWLFQFLREAPLGLSKKPATAELLDWLYVLFKSLDNQVPPTLQEHPSFKDSVRCTLLKNQADQKRVDEFIAAWEKQAAPKQP